MKDNHSITSSEWRNCTDISFQFEIVLFDKPLFFICFTAVLCFSNYLAWIMRKFKTSLNFVNLNLIIYINDYAVRLLNGFISLMVSKKNRKKNDKRGQILIISMYIYERIFAFQPLGY